VTTVTRQVDARARRAVAAPRPDVVPPVRHRIAPPVGHRIVPPVRRRIARVVVAVLVLSLAGAPLAVAAQTTGRVYRIGFLGQTSARDHAAAIAVLRRGLREAGYEEGRNLVIEYRWAEGRLDRLPALAAELVGLEVDLIVTHGTPGSRAAKKATSTIPVVIATAGDPVRSGVVASLSRPGGNVTGLSVQEFEVNLKRLELLKEVAPGITRVGYLRVPGLQTERVREGVARDEDAAARALGLELRQAMVRKPEDLPGAFSEFARQGVHAVLVPNTSLLNARAALIAGLAATHRLPTIGAPVFAKAGGLLAYGPREADMYRRAAGYVDRILRGARPADLPIEQPTTFELIVNLGTARALRLTVPPSLLARADQVIE
jgi:putative ABC transport system substrate-binding protein